MHACYLQTAVSLDLAFTLQNAFDLELLHRLPRLAAKTVRWRWCTMWHSLLFVLLLC